jgi:ketosteroid isomerase-like protein
MPALTPQECDGLKDACINGGNLDGLLALYEPGACLVQQTGEPAKTGAALRQSLAAFISMQAKIKTNVTQVIIAASEHPPPPWQPRADHQRELAVLYNDWTLTAGGLSLSGKAVEVVRRQADGSWKFVVDDPFGRT